MLDGGGKSAPMYTEEGAYAVVEICGPLFQKEALFADSYDGIRRRVALALDSSMPAVCLRISSPGGDWCGSLELARDLRSMARAAKKRLVAFTDSQALSAAYAIACAADRIVATESAMVGSIGVWQPLLDVTAQDAMSGVKIAIAASGSAKADRNPHMGITDEAFTRMQAQVDEQAELFFEHVSAMRGIPVSKIRSLEGADFFGQRGFAAGLTDEIVNSWAVHVTSSAESSMSAQASKYDEAMGAMKRAAEGEDEDAQKAKKALKALSELFEGKDKDKDGDKDGDAKGKAKAAAEEEEKKAKAEEEEKARKAKAEAEEEEKKAKAMGAGPSLFDLTRKVHALEAERDAEKDKHARDKLLAQRPDFSPEIKASLAKVSLSQVEEAVKTWPKLASKLGAAAAGARATGTRGLNESREITEIEPSPQSVSDDDYIARRMGVSQAGTGIRRIGRSLELGPMTPEQARDFLKKRNASAEAAPLSAAEGE